MGSCGRATACRKVVVKDLDVVCRSRPDGGNVVGPPLDYFAIRFLYGENQSPPRLQVGPREGPAQGWVPTSSVLEWDTRLMAPPDPTRRPSRAGDLPGGALFARRPGGPRLSPARRTMPDRGGRGGTAHGQATALGMPILQSKSIPEPDGSTRTIFEVASLVRDLAPPPPPPSEPPADLLPALRRVEIAFAIDTTASMQATIVAARHLAEQLIADASRADIRDVVLRLALVEYRDRAREYGFVTRVVTPVHRSRRLPRRARPDLGGEARRWLG